MNASWCVLVLRLAARTPPPEEPARAEAEAEAEPEAEPEAEAEAEAEAEPVQPTPRTPSASVALDPWASPNVPESRAAPVAGADGVTPLEPGPPRPGITKGQVEHWQQRRRVLTRTVAAFGTIAGLGALFVILPFTFGGDGEDGTGLVPFAAAGGAALTLGGAGTVLAAPFLGHHLRWDRPSALARTASAHAARRSRLHTRKLFIALAAEGGAMALGGVAIGIGWAAAGACRDTQDLGCTSPRILGGSVPGFSLVGLGGLAMVSTGILIGLQRRHGHTRAAIPRLTALSPSGATLRF